MASQARFYDGRTAQAQEVNFRATASELVIIRPEDSGVLARWPAAELLVLGDIEHEAVPPIARAGDDARLVIEDPEMRRQLALALPALAGLAQAPPAIARRIALYGASLVALIGCLWFGIDLGAERIAPLVPFSWQHKLGESVLKEITAGKTLCHGAPGLAAINGLANQLVNLGGYDHKVTVHIVKGGPVNAFTLPGGILVFYSDLIREARNGSEVAGVLAHELGHVLDHDAMKGLARQYGIETLLKLMTGGYADSLGPLTSGGSLLYALRNGRAAERAADAQGVGLLEKAGLRADGVAAFFERLLKDDKPDAAEIAGIWSSHPPTRERIEATKRPATGAEPFTAAQWRALRAVCE
jgi:Zn-dependent protease with chaperone function